MCFKAEVQSKAMPFYTRIIMCIKSRTLVERDSERGSLLKGQM